MTDSFLPYAKQNITKEDLKAVEDALFSKRITRGEKTQAFEQAVASYCGASYAVAFSNATCALFAAMYVVRANRQDRFFVPTNTFIASAGCGMSMGLQPQLIDIDRSTGNLSLGKLQELAMQPASRGRTIVMAVHFAGIACDMRRLERSFVDPDGIIIEDAAHAVGSLYPTQERVGSCAKSHMTIFSFHPAKTITCGEGGMVTTNSEELYHLLKRYRNNGIEREQKYLVSGKESLGFYEVHEITGNFHMTEMQAALGLSQLQRLDLFVEKRRTLVSCYRKELKNLDHVVLFPEEYDARTSYHLMVLQIDFSAYKTTRLEVMEKLYAAGIGTEVHYIPLYRHPVFDRNQSKQDFERDFPESEKYYAETLSLPLYYDLTEQEVERVCLSLKKILGAYLP